MTGLIVPDDPRDLDRDRRRYLRELAGRRPASPRVRLPGGADRELRTAGVIILVLGIASVLLLLALGPAPMP